MGLPNQGVSRNRDASRPPDGPRARRGPGRALGVRYASTRPERGNSGRGGDGWGSEAVVKDSAGRGAQRRDRGSFGLVRPSAPFPRRALEVRGRQRLPVTADSPACAPVPWPCGTWVKSLALGPGLPATASGGRAVPEAGPSGRSGFSRRGTSLAARTRRWNWARIRPSPSRRLHHARHVPAIEAPRTD
jgi:hypothetical protein